MAGLADHEVEQLDRGQRPPGSARANDQPCPLLPEGFEHEGPGSDRGEAWRRLRRVVGTAAAVIDRPAQDEDALGLERLDAEPGPPALRPPNALAQAKLLEPRQDALGTRSAAVVDRVVAVPAGPPVAHLNEPGPDAPGWGIDRDGHRGRARRLGDQLVAGKGPCSL